MMGGQLSMPRGPVVQGLIDLLALKPSRLGQTSQRWLVIGCAAGVFTAGCGATEAGVDLIDGGARARMVTPLACSYDGSVVVGRAWRPDDVPIEKAIRWTLNNGVEFLDPNRGSGGSEALSVSLDGASIVGRRSSYGFSFSNQGGLVLYPQLPGTSTSQAVQLARDGTRVRVEPASFASTGNPMLIDRFGVQTALTREYKGRQVKFGLSSPNLKTHVSQLDWSLLLMSDLAGNDREINIPLANASAVFVGDGGGLVAGVYYVNGKVRGLFRLTDAEGIEKHPLPEFWNSISYPVFSDDARVAVFNRYSGDFFTAHTFVWRESDGVFPLASFCRGNFPVPRYRGAKAPTLSGDGRVVVQGVTVSLTDFPSYYRIYLDQGPVCRADFDGDGVVGDDDFVIFVQSMDLVDTPSIDDRCDLNDDQMVEDADFVLFAAAYAELVCP